MSTVACTSSVFVFGAGTWLMSPFLWKSSKPMWPAATATVRRKPDSSESAVVPPGGTPTKFRSNTPKGFSALTPFWISMCARIVPWSAPLSSVCGTQKSTTSAASLPERVQLTTQIAG